MKKITLKCRLLSFFVILTMISGMLQMPVFAQWTDGKWTDEYTAEWNLTDLEAFTEAVTPDTMPAIETVLVKPNTDSSTGYDEGNIDVKAGDTIYVALKAKNFSKFAKMNNGVVQICTSLIYDTNYLSPLQSSDNSFRTQALANMKKATNSFIAQSISNQQKPEEWDEDDEGPWSPSDVYTLDTKASVRDSEFDSNETSPLNQDLDSLKKMTLSFGFSGTSDQIAKIEDDTYVSIYALKVKTDLPRVDAGDDQSPIISSLGVALARSGNTSLTLDPDDEWNKAYGGTSGLHQYMKLIDGVNLWPKSYIVTYDADGGTYPTDFDNTESVKASETKTVDDESVSYGNPTLKNAASKVISENIIPPTGKIFKEWQTEKGETFDEAYDVTDDITVKAVYDDGYNVNFNLNADDATYADGSNTLKSITLGQGESPKSNAIADAVGGDPERTGYTFKGWYTTKANGTFDTKYTDDGAPGSKIITDIDGQTDLYAMWDKNNGTYTLNFNNNPPEGATSTTEAVPNVVKYDADDTLNSVIGGLPTEPTTDKTGYKFLGWYKNQAGDGDKLDGDTALLTYTGASAETPETTVYAKWGYVDEPDPENPDDPNPYDYTITVTFPKDAGADTYNGGTSKNGTINDRYIKYGEKIPNLPTAAEMERNGKGFGGWYTEDEDSDGKISDTAIKVDADTVIDNTFGVDNTNGGTVTLYAHWIDKVTITYDMNGLAGTAPVLDPLVPGAKFTPPAYDDITGHDSDYELVEWNTKKDGSGDSYAPDTEATVPSGDTTLYAIWNYDETKDDAVSITFDGNDTDKYGAELTPNNGDPDTNKYTIVRKSGTTIDPNHFPTAEREKYTFNHWDKDKTAAAGAQGTLIAEADEGTKTMTVYAIWTVTNEDDECTVTFKNEATDANAYATVTVATGDVVGPQMPADPTRAGYNFVKWLNQADSTEFTSATEVNGDITVIADWTQEFKLEYDGNGLPAAVTLPETAKGAKNETAKVGNITANGEKVELVEWNTKADGSGDSYQPNDTVTFNDDDIKLYAIWNSTDPNAKTITFRANDSDLKEAELNPSDDGNDKQYTMKRATGQTITAAQMPTATREDYDFDHWGKTATEAALGAGEKQADITVGNEDITMYAIWTVKDDVTKYNVTFKLHDATPQTEVGPIEVAEGDCVGDRMPANPTREAGKYTFKQWTTGDAKTEFTKDTPITEDTVVDANWTIKVDVKFTVTEYNYDGTPHTPITAGNYVVFPKGSTSDPLEGLTLKTEKYKKVTGKDETQDPPVYTTEDLPDNVTTPEAGGEYTYENLTLTGDDTFTEYEIHTIPATFKIKAKDVVITIDKNYQYTDDSAKIENITITADDSNMGTAITGGDIKVTFTDKDNNETNTMPTDFGHYTIKVEAANDNYNITTVEDGYGATGDAIPLYLINLNREIKVDYMDGTAKDTTTDVYATVTFAAPDPLNNVSSANTTLASQTPALDVPKQGTDFDPPTGMRIKKFVTGTKQEDDTIADQADFDKDTPILLSETNEALTIYAVYENADWTLSFVDTKTDPTAETFDDYTVDAEKSVKDGLKKKGSTDVTDPDEKTLPAPTSAPENKMFKGWTTDPDIAQEDGLTAADFETVDGTDGKYKSKLFTDETVPTATELAAGNNAITVYAVYVKSSDATLKSALFKEILVTKDDEGNVTNEETKADLPYVDDVINPSDTTVTFDPDTDTYNIIVKNDFEKLLADLEPTQPGSTIAVKVNDKDVTNETTGVPEGHTQAKPGVDDTVYDKDTNTNSTNTIVVTVTAPDGTTKDYTFNVLRYTEAKIVLNYGNSPFGEIMRTNWDDDKKAAAKAEFSAKQHFTPDFALPNRLITSKDFFYNVKAWNGGPNMDEDETALFSFTFKDFVDPGFIATDSLGKAIAPENITRSFSITLLKDSDMNSVSSTPAPYVTTGASENDTFAYTSFAGGKNAVVKPGIYQLEYSFTDTSINETITENRNVIIIPMMGDTNVDNLVKSNDATPINTQAVSVHPKLNKNDISSYNLLLYRVYDTNGDGLVKSNDAVPVNNMAVKGYGEAAGYAVYYKEFKK